MLRLARVTLTVCGCACAMLVAACGAKAPVSTFPALQTRIRPGHTVYVIDTGGRESRGTLVTVSATELVIGGDDQVRRFASGDVRQVQRYGDSLWNGTLIGIAAVTPGTLLADPQYGPCQSDPDGSCAKTGVGSRAIAIGLGGLMGMAIDALIRHREPVYVAPGAVVGSVRVAPLLRARGAGLAVIVEY